MFLGSFRKHHEHCQFDLLLAFYNSSYPRFKRSEFHTTNGILSFYNWTSKERIKPFEIFEIDHYTLLIIGNLFNSGQFDFKQFVLSYEHKGAECLNDLNGEYAGVFIDYKSGKYYAFKDHTGTVPLTLFKSDETIYFGSEERLLLKYLNSDQELSNPFIISQFYSFEPNYAIPANDQTLKVMGGSYVLIDEFVNHRYWKPDKTNLNQKISKEDVLSKLNQLLKDSMSDRIAASTKEIGVHISGGLDSAIIAGFLKEQYSDSIFGFSWSPPEEFKLKESAVYDERKEVISLSERLNLPVEFTPYTEEDFLSEPKNWRFPLDFPYERNLLKNSASHDVRTIFTGLGGDEFIGLQKLAYLHHLFRTGKWTTFFAYCTEKGFVPKVKFLINEGLFPLRRKPMLTKKFSANLLAYLPAGWKNESVESYRKMYKSPKDCMNATIDYHHIESRCEHWHNLGAHFGVKYTYPLLDKRIIEFCYSLPPEVFYSEKIEKVLIRKLAKPYATDSMLNRERTLDPALFSNQQKTETKALKRLIEQFKRTSQLAELKFFDITKLDSAIENYLELDELQKSKLLYVLKYYLHAHYYISAINEKHD